MRVFWITGSVVEQQSVEHIAALRQREDGFLWVDMPECDDEAARLLADTFRFHAIAIQACRERTHLPKVHAYADHVFMALQIPQVTPEGEIHLTEMNQFVGRRYLVTVHEPLSEGECASTQYVQGVLQRMEAGRLHPHVPIELSFHIVSSIARHMESLITTLAARIGTLEEHVTKRHMRHAEHVLESMFRLRHELLSVRTVAARTREGYARIVVLAPRFLPQDDRPFIEDLMDQFDRVRNLCEGEQQFLQGVIDFYQNRTITKLNVAMERLALISVILLPVTAVASIYGMNIIVNVQTQYYHLMAVLITIMTIMVLMVLWARRQGWW